MGLSTEGLVCFCFQSRKVLDNGPTEKSGAQTSSGLSSNVSTRKCGESVLKSTFSLQDVERAIKLKYPSMMKHFCLGLGCPYLSGFQLWNTDTFYECFLLCLYIVDHFASRQFIFSCQGKLKKVTINCSHGFKILKYSAEQELMMVLQLRRLGKALD